MTSTTSTLARHVRRTSVLVVALAVVAPAAAQYSGSYGCTDDCSGHQAGYAWAERNDISDPSTCGGNSLSFIQGCIDYAEARQREMREDAGCHPDDDSCETD